MISGARRRRLFGGLPGGRRGIALIAVLWALVLLALVAASFTRTTRTEINLVRNLVDNMQAEALADAGVHLAVEGLMRPETEDGWRADGTVREVQLDGGELRVAVRDEGGKIDLNVAPAALIAALFQAVGEAPERSAALADAVADFRDRDHLRRLNGAEDDDYAAAGLPVDAKDGPFAAIEELQQVFGIDRALYDRVRAAVTVHSRQRKPQAATAPPAVQAALSGDTIVPENGDEAEAEPPAPAPPNTLGQAGARSRIRVYGIHAEARLASGALFTREAVVRLAAKPEQPFAILVWRRGQRLLFADTLRAPD